ncbi:MAG: alpha/beta hydrolase [Halobacteria archaeon]
MAGFQVKFADLPGPPPFRLAYVDEGPRDADALLFLHGWASTHEQWSAVVERLSKKWRCVAVDLPSYGQSEVPVTDYTLEFFARSALQLLDSIGVRRAVPVGSSMGGMVSMEFTLRWPERVEALVLVDSGGMWRPRGFARRRARSDFAFAIYKALEPVIGRSMMKRAFHDHRPGIEEMKARAAALREDPKERARRRTRFNSMMHVIATSYRKRAAEIRAPTLVVWGRQDRLVSLKLGERLARTIPGARLEIIEECGHLPSVERPGELARLVEGFLERMGDGLSFSIF